MSKVPAPEYEGTLRKFMLMVPEEIERCSGIKIFGKLIKSIAFTTDVSTIRNVNADAAIAVYPYTPQPIINQAFMLAADIPVFCGIGGGLTSGKRVVNLALHAEFQGAIGVVLNAPTPDEIVQKVAHTVDVPVVVTVVSDRDDIEARLKSGTSIFNVSAAKNTAELVRKIKRAHPEVPVIATGGPTKETILETIAAGANAITWTPPSPGEVFAGVMQTYREGKPHP